MLVWLLFALMVHGLILDQFGKRDGLKLAMGLKDIRP
tara:strand:- start:1123 stop:1233 length:111 start_codon:yes stop_codon:yes gene_type:complete